MGRQRVGFPMTPQLRKFFQAIGKTGGTETAQRMSPGERQERARKAAGARRKKSKKGWPLSASVSAFSLRAATRPPLGAGVANFRWLLAASGRGLYMSVDYESEGQRFDSSRAHHFRTSVCPTLGPTGRG